MNGYIETVAIPLLRFKTGYGTPTCSIGIKERSTCKFLYSRKLGVEFFCSENGETLNRELIDGEEIGHLIPHQQCIMWREDKKS